MAIALCLEWLSSNCVIFCNRSAILDKKKSEDDLQFAAYLIDHSRELVGAYKARMLASAKKSFSNPLAKPNSNLASLIEESRRLKFVKSLVSSRGTLVVIPSVLMDHWEVSVTRFCAGIVPPYACGPHSHGSLRSLKSIYILT